MSLFVLKIIGILSMFLDHYYFIISGPKILNIIGRVAFPIFAFALTEGYRHKKFKIIFNKVRDICFGNTTTFIFFKY